MLASLWQADAIDGNHITTTNIQAILGEDLRDGKVYDYRAYSSNWHDSSLAQHLNLLVGTSSWPLTEGALD
jgi:hypothetical protein